jgi:hypothetical protein
MEIIQSQSLTGTLIQQESCLFLAADELKTFSTSNAIVGVVLRYALHAQGSPGNARGRLSSD